MSKLTFTQPIDGTGAFFSDELGRKLYWPDPTVDAHATVGAIAGGAPVDAVAGTASITYSANPVTAGKKVTILDLRGGSKVYTFRASVTADYDVKIEAAVDDTGQNLTDAINQEDAEGVGDNVSTGKYMVPDSDGPNPFCSGVLNAGGNVIDLTATVKGTSGNLVTPTTDEAELTISKFSTTPTGIDGTVGDAGDQLFDSNNVYTCIAAATVSDTGKWKKAALSAL